MIPVLAGGGTRLPAHVGVSTALEQMQHGIAQLVGVSGDSILADNALYQEWAGDDTPVVYVRLRSTRAASAVKESSVFPLPNYLTMLIRTFMTSISREYISTQCWRNTLVIEPGDISPLEFSVSLTQKENLLRCGLETVETVPPMKLGQERHRPGGGLSA